MELAQSHYTSQFQVLQYQLNKLQTYKGSFQAWKCVSLGYAMLASVLVISKWHEVSTDLRLIASIDQHLANLTLATSGDTSTASSLALSANANAGDQLLKQEVETFLVEFGAAKTTLGLSSLLVLVYVVSWVLMALAVNDTRISNDVSLRNILLLSTFGAIDMAASTGFVAVRLIMFNLRSGSQMAADVLDPSAPLRDAPSGLSADQLAAFTALRLTAMRSSSAQVDLYVCSIVALLTVLRLHAVVRAVAYYRFLRKFNDHSRNYQRRQQLAAALSVGRAHDAEKRHADGTAPSPSQSTSARPHLSSAGWYATGPRMQA